ncbi:hypothetical protein Clacol_001060 [Clathrus columnatus]|uniref:Isochorismatase-like domain-containing protein n=1 Tax=Clathrus columnatus TaxID=1419009 RepID=A0AAV5A299_9AGAM|nr:hypothetical protein Clacol_001060 [Clathrus columnatus]
MVRPPRPRVTEPQVFGSIKQGNFWVEYPSGLVDLTRASPLTTNQLKQIDVPAKTEGQLDIPVNGDRTIRVDMKQSAFVIIDMQKNWGLTSKEITILPPALARSFTRNASGGFGSDMGGNWGPLLLRGSRNADLYGPLQAEWLNGKELGSDVWMHKNRMGGLWGPGTALDLYLKEEGIKTLFFAGVNTDQCVLGTLVDAYFTGYDVVIVMDATATGSPEGGLSNVLYNGEGSYGFVTDSARISQAA